MASKSSQFSWVKGKAIGSGSFGTVHLATDTATGAVFAVKSAHQSESDAAFESLKNEADILATLPSSPHVIKCLGTEKDNKEISMFMEYMEGGSLSDAVAASFGGALDEQAVRFYTREILLGLAYLHRNGIAHCDLKCKNVLIGSDGGVKLADFGCARKLSSRNNRVFGGTPLWMAPEALRNEDGTGTDLKSDIWSLGCTVIEMATGRPPWSGDVSSREAAILKIVSSREIPKFPKRFSKEGVDFLEICLDRDPKRRWSAEELLLRHPFVNSSSPTLDSPVSVLTFGCYPESESCDTEDESEFANNFDFDLGFNCRYCCEEEEKEEENTRVMKWQLQDDSEFFGGSSKLGMSWITVR